MTALPGGVPVFLVVTIVAFVILGSVLEGIPVVLARIGLFAPPFGVGYYAACAISRIHPDEGMGPIVGYIVALLIGTLVVAWISIGFL